MKFSTQRLPEAMNLPTDPPPVDPKVEILPQLCEEEGATLEPTFPVIAAILSWAGKYAGRR